MEDMESAWSQVEVDEGGNVWEREFGIVEGDDSLLAKTKMLFNNDRNLVGTLFSSSGGTEFLGNRKLHTTSGGRLPKGSGVLSEDFLVGRSNGNIFCRTWTTTNQYNNVKSLQKNSGLIKYEGVKIRENIENSVLGSNGFVKISPYKLDDNSEEKGDVKRYMFSIENLAWNDSLENLPRVEQGPGDLTTGTKGRIMWFPPYGMNFTDTSSVNWDTTNFIGRGEPIYTYNNTERTGTLDFQVIIDYPDYMNSDSIKTDEMLASLAAGCSDYKSLLSIDEQNTIESENQRIKKIRSAKTGNVGKLEGINIYFENAIATVDETYEAVGTSLAPLPPTGSNVLQYGLNRPWTDSPNTLTLKLQLNGSYKAYRMDVTGYASKDGTVASNSTLSENRANNVKQWILDNLDDKTDPYFSKRIKTPGFNGDEQALAAKGTPDGEGTKKDRFVSIIFEYDPEYDEQVTDAANAKTEATKESKELKNNIKRRFHNEGRYFKELKNSTDVKDKIVYKTIKEKIGFFQPAFHSITPEGFNSRLNFLHQCTRQGPTLQKQGAQNLAFGAPPICILRVGDFYHTKIAIDNMALTFDPLVWDLNPEGVGVQPMIANVSLSFKFIGGSSLTGPINKLQNAVSFNYFANTEIYDPRADTLIAKTPDELEKDGDGSHKIKDGEDRLWGKIKQERINAEVIGVDLTRPEVDQILQVEPTLIKPVQPVESGSANTNDKFEMSNLVLANVSYFDGTDTIELTFNYNQKDASTFELNKSYKGKVYLNKKSESVYSQYLGYVTADPNGSGNFIINDTKETSVAIFSSGSLTGAVDVFDMTEASVNALTELRENISSDGIIKVVWSNGLSVNINFN
jgi:hypothetical protein